MDVNTFPKLALLLMGGIAAGCASSANRIILPGELAVRDTTAPPVQREMRGLWVATVGNGDWPSKRTLTAEQQRAELVDIMDRASAAGFNAIIFHVRPAADAVYKSAYEPWGAMLTGTQGVDPGYDPLQLAIEEAHARGMELHAWINPFRAGNTRDTLALAKSHVFHERRDLVRIYGRNIWMDPGEPDVQDRAMRAIRDIVTRYDVDGVHADDYFYPYVENDSAGKPIPFPDDSTYARYGGLLTLADWRRANIDRFVERMYREVHAIKPTVKVGLSPFGIWRPGYPPSVQGLDAFASIYADSRKWLQQGWVDYLVPQLYWPIASPKQSFPDLLDWWIGQNVMSRGLWPGLAAYRVANGTPTALSLEEIPDQIRIIRKYGSSTGHILFNTTATLKRNGGALASTLWSETYSTRALVPASPWLDSSRPAAPTLRVLGDTVRVTPGAGESPRWWAVRLRANGIWTTHTLFSDHGSFAVIPTTDRILVQGVDEAGNAGEAAEWRGPRQ